MNMNGLGIALGAAVDEWHNQQEEARKKAADQRAAAAESRANEQFGWQRAEEDRKRGIQDAQDAIMKKYAGYSALADNGDFSFMPELHKAYNSQTGGFNDGHTVALQSTPNGNTAHFVDGSGNVVRSVELNPQNMRSMLREAQMAELAATSPEMAIGRYDNDRNYDLKSRDVATKERGNDINERFRAAYAQHFADQYDLGKREVEARRAAISASHQLNPAQQYGLDLAKRADEERAKIVSLYNQGQMTYEEARRAINMSNVKYGGTLPEPKQTRGQYPDALGTKLITEIYPDYAAKGDEGMGEFDKLYPGLREQYGLSAAPQLSFAPNPKQLPSRTAAPPAENRATQLGKSGLSAAGLPIKPTTPRVVAHDPEQQNQNAFSGSSQIPFGLVMPNVLTPRNQR